MNNLKLLFLVICALTLTSQYPAKWAFELCLNERPQCSVENIYCGSDPVCTEQIKTFANYVASSPNCTNSTQYFATQSLFAPIPGA